MTQLYINWAIGDAVYTDQVKRDESIGFADITAEAYLQHIREFEFKKPKAKFKFRGKKEQPKEVPIITAHPAQAKPLTKVQVVRNNKREQATKKIELWRYETRLSRNHGWEHLEVMAIAAAAYMAGVKFVMGDIPEDQWNKKTLVAIDQAKKSIQDWQDYEVDNYKKLKEA